jgi:predicted RNase H-like HicB family nuclease
MGQRVSVCLEIGAQATGAFVPEYPGCWVFGQTKESALTKIPAVITDWFSWAKEDKTIPTDIRNGIEVEVTEMLRVNGTQTKFQYSIKMVAQSART